MKLKSKLLIITVSLLFLAILTAALGVRLLSDLEKANNKWSGFIHIESAKNQALTDINRHFGYGGFIHHFKNLVLRRDLQYLALAEQSLDATYTSIDQYLSITDDAEESVCIMRFKNVVDLYSQKMTGAHLNNQLTTSTPADLDALVKVDDSDALIALRTLTEAIQDRSTKIQTETEFMMQQSSYFLFAAGSALIAILLVVIFVVVSITISLVKSIRYNRLLFEFAPDAMLVTSEIGQILRVNKKAIKLFGYSAAEFVQLSVDDLVPQDIRPYHRKFRDEYLKKQSGLTANGVSMPFRAISKNGALLPVEVALIMENTTIIGSYQGLRSIERDMERLA